MTDAVPDPLPLTAAGPSPDVAELEAELATGDGSRLARYTARAGTAVRVVAMFVTVTGVAALAFGLVAFRESAIAMVVVAVLCLPAILLPRYVARRTKALAHAAGHPREVAAQARDLVGRVHHSAELESLATRLSLLRSGRPPLAGTPEAAGRRGRFRQGVTMARLASTVIGQAQPDEDRHALLVPFTPERLGRTWAAISWLPWVWVLAALILVASVPAFVVSLF